ncbi:Dabb family protein [Thalassospira sp.]|uniref:Dabb family protein n=1 Tax=Thalassospira sp. TaxID=1912094 RepID=UPI000C5CC756|nr:Dabb family protein [Thalassospira sp.]MAL38856.1 stress responsive protein [Thalassospira sp.]HAY49938.1 stress responsive protein [Thalassospira sp.]|tara:strand:+ start:1378 stop:1743 length:366 start_codon:yes stop_codon:yes gene_type:complete
MLRHIVLLQVADHVNPDQVETLIDQLAKAAMSVPGMVAFCGGKKKAGSGLSQGFTHGFNIDFVDEQARDAYLAELDSDRVGSRLSEITVGGLGGILVMNIDIDDIRTPDKNPDKKPQLRWV